jgi:hypothetical protein
MFGYLEMGHSMSKHHTKVEYTNQPLHFSLQFGELVDPVDSDCTMIYYTHHRHVATPHNVWHDVSSSDSEQLNDLLHTSEQYDHSPLCVQRCLFRRLRTEWVLMHIMGVWLLPTLCVLMFLQITLDQWMIYYSHHRKMVTPLYVCNDILL